MYSLSLKSLSPVSLGCPSKSVFFNTEEQLQMKDLVVLPCLWILDPGVYRALRISYRVVKLST